MKNPKKIKPEDTDLERRVLAHERVLMSLIAHISRGEPRFLDHLAKMFVAPMDLERREQDFVDTDSHAEAFIRAVTALCKADGQRSPTVAQASPGPGLRLRSVGDGSALMARHERVTTTFRNGIWTVTVDGTFAGDYSDRDAAEAAAVLARLTQG